MAGLMGHDWHIGPETSRPDTRQSSIYRLLSTLAGAMVDAKAEFFDGLDHAQ